MDCVGTAERQIQRLTNTSFRVDMFVAYPYKNPWKPWTLRPKTIKVFTIVHGSYTAVPE